MQIRDLREELRLQCLYLQVAWSQLEIRDRFNFFKKLGSYDLPLMDSSTESAVDGRLDWLPELRC